MMSSFITIAPVMPDQDHTTPKTPAVKLKGVALPTEHGSWGMVAEPIVAALAIAFSVGGVFVAIAFFGAFLMRQPLRVLLAERTAKRQLPQGKPARKYFVWFSMVFLAGAIGASVTAPLTSFWPLLLAGSLAALQIYYDSLRQSRRLAPELAGSVAISSSAAVIALAGGWASAAAVALWIVLICRSVPSIFYVRERLLLEKKKPYSYYPSVIMSAATIPVTAALAYYGLSSWIVAAMMTVLFIRAALGLSHYSNRRKAMQIGVLEVVFGTLTIAAIFVGYYFRF
jgi:hypothetical protein